VKIKRICYISTAGSKMDEKLVDKIADAAAIANKSQDITGILLFNGINFWQIIEGHLTQLTL
jgi:Sensors of blue-light using FAD